MVHWQNQEVGSDLPGVPQIIVLDLDAARPSTALLVVELSHLLPRHALVLLVLQVLSPLWEGLAEVADEVLDVM
jgi:hypothetical protein